MSTSLSTLRLPLQTRMLSTRNSHTLLSSTLLNTSSPMASLVPAPTVSLALLLMDKSLHLLGLLRPRLVVSFLLAGSSNSINRVSASST